MAGAVASLQDFIGRITEIIPGDDEIIVYRGHSDRQAYLLQPSIFRNNEHLENEHELLREVVVSHPSEFHGDMATFDRLVRVQHYSLPTRLLDVTVNPLVALFFATKEKPNTSGEVVVFRVQKTSLKYFDSDTVSCIANLSNLKKAEKDTIDFTKKGREFNSQKSVDRLIQFIRAEKPHFRDEISPNDLRSVICVKPKKNNRRILAQSGAFLLFGLTHELDNRVVPGVTIERIVVNAYKKNTILTQLDRVAINESTMFPEIEKAAKYISRTA